MSPEIENYLEYMILGRCPGEVYLKQECGSKEGISLSKRADCLRCWGNAIFGGEVAV